MNDTNKLEILVPSVGDRVTFPMHPIGYIVAGTVKSVNLRGGEITVTQVSGTEGGFDLTIPLSGIKEIRPFRSTRNRPLMRGHRDKTLLTKGMHRSR